MEPQINTDELSVVLNNKLGLMNLVNYQYVNFVDVI
ncbi:hypothetical protein NSTC745_01657 [Nostoc sp. DSM 114161]|jgi:hypothetical protein